MRRPGRVTRPASSGAARRAGMFRDSDRMAVFVCISELGELVQKRTSWTVWMLWHPKSIGKIRLCLSAQAGPVFHRIA